MYNKIRSNEEATLIKTIQDIKAGPIFPEKDFIDSGITYQQVYNMALNIISRYKNKKTVLCIATENKAVITASLLSALLGGPALVLPYSFSPKIFYEIYSKTNCSAAVISDTEKNTYTNINVNVIIPESNNSCRETNPYTIAPNKPFITLFTGGSTGKPSIWSKTPANLLGEAIYLIRKFNITSDKKIVATVPPYHIYGFLFSVIIPFLASASVLDEIPVYPNEIINTIEKSSASVLVSIPIHYKALNGYSINNKHRLELAFSSAGALNENDGKWFFKQTGIGVTEIYGSTETGGIAIKNNTIEKEFLTPFDIVDWKVIKERLYIRSPFLSPELKRDKNGYFKTADRVDYQDKKFTLLGRMDNIIKVGGKRVDLDDICEKIKTIKNVTDGFVFSKHVNEGRENEIIALVETMLDKKIILKSLVNLIEPYAMPRQIKTIKKIPVTKSGKYDKKMLIKLFSNNFHSE